MTCDFLSGKNCVHPEASFFLKPIVSNVTIIKGDSEVSISTATVAFKCKGQDKCKVYKILELLKKQKKDKSSQ